MLNQQPDGNMVALCLRCHAPLSLADLGYTICLNCHWQDLFDYEAESAPGELRLVLYVQPQLLAGQASDSAGRLWVRFLGDGQTWCVLCGDVISSGWMQGSPGGPRIHLCADHVELRRDRGR